MTKTGLQYDRMVEEALRGVVGRALAEVAENGLPGDHHFYITFRTDRPGVELAGHLRQRYPHEMTIVLQYQFQDLNVGDDAFSVCLSFGGIMERLHVPFSAVVAFADPSVRFGLQFEGGETAQEVAAPGEPAPQEPSAATGDEGAAAESAVAQSTVVALDSFRKK
jgi:hypothetical protein